MSENLTLPASAPEHGAANYRLAILGALTALAVIAVALHLHGVNGPWYWKWAWRRVPGGRWFAATAAASLPCFGGLLLFGRSRRSSLRVGGAILLLMAGSVALKLTACAVVSEPPGFTQLSAIVHNDLATSYYTDARILMSQDPWLYAYPRFLPYLHLHTMSKPPGAVAWYMMFLRIFGPGDRAAIDAALGIALLCSLSIPATYWLVQLLTRGDGQAGFCAAAWLALCPGFALFFPFFDPLFPVLIFLLVVLWHRAVERNSLLWAAAMGIALAGVLFVTFNILVIGFFLVLYPFALGKRPWRQNLLRVARTAPVVLVAFAAANLLLWVVFQYDPIATFRAAFTMQHALIEHHSSNRPYPWTILFDLTDFLLGAGWVAIPLVIWGVMRAYRAARKAGGMRSFAADVGVFRIAVLALLQMLVIAGSGLIQGETARCWNFMYPLLLVPVGIELARWSVPQRLFAIACLVVVTLVIGQNMTVGSG